MPFNHLNHQIILSSPFLRLIHYFQLPKETKEGSCRSQRPSPQLLVLPPPPWLAPAGVTQSSGTTDCPVQLSMMGNLWIMLTSPLCVTTQCQRYLVVLLSQYFLSSMSHACRQPGSAQHHHLHLPLEADGAESASSCFHQPLSLEKVVLSTSSHCLNTETGSI